MAVAATSKKVQATLANFKVIVNGQSKSVTSDQLLYKGNTYLQLREAAKILGYEVNYASSTRSIEFSAKSQSQADWITLIDLSASNGYQVNLKGDSSDVYNISKNLKQSSVLMLMVLKKTRRKL